MKNRSLSARISDLETSSLHWGYYLATFLGLVIVRNLLESALGPDRVLGFVHFASPSAMMVLDHFLLFYVSLFLGFSILLSLLARESVGRVMKVMTPAWVLVLVPPAIDAVVTGGRGMHITYVLEISPVIFRFFDPTAALDRISPGQRVEVLLACCLAMAYVHIKTRRAWRSLAAFAGMYLLVAGHGVLPSAYARLTNLLAPGPAASSAAAYEAVFRSGGLVVEESRKLALLFLFTSIAAGWLAFRMQSQEKAAATCRNVRPLRSLHYTGMTALGLALGWVLFRAAGVDLGGAGDALGAVAVCASTFFAFQASVALNDLFDEETDRITNETRPLITGVLSRREMMLEASVFALASLLLAVNVKYATFLFMLVALAVSLLYSAPPVRLKRFPLIATLTLGFLSLVGALIGFSALAEERALSAFPERLSWLLFLAIGLAFTAKDLKDTRADRRTGVRTLPVLLGIHTGRVVISVFLLTAYLLVPLFLPYPALTIPAVVLGLLSVLLVFVWRRPRVDNVLLAMYLLFALAVAIMVIQDPGPMIGDGEMIEAKALQLQAGKAEAMGDRALAAAAYSAAASVLDDDPRLLERTGVALFESGRLNEAGAVLARSVAAQPTSPVGLEYLAMVEAKRGETEIARERMSNAIERGVRPRIFLTHLGEMDLEHGDARAARALLANALRLGQPDIPARIRYADAVLATGTMENAHRLYESIAARHPDSAEARDALGRFYHLSGELQQALGEFRAAIGLNPYEAPYWNNLGVAYGDLGDSGAALDALNYATRLDSRFVDPYVNRGRVYDALGRHAEARREYLLALEIDPAFTPARAGLGGEWAKDPIP